MLPKDENSHEASAKDKFIIPRPQETDKDCP